MALTATQLAGAIRIGDGTSALTEPDLSILTRLNSVCTSYVNRYISGREITEGDPPVSLVTEDLKDEAVILLAGYLYDKPSWHGERLANAFVNCGARELLTPFLTVGAGVV